MDGTGMGMAWMLLWGLVGLALLVLIVLGIVLTARRLSGGSHWTEVRRLPEESPRQVLDRRLAAGEIDEEEYQRLRARIEGG
ncbi:SHOCT domain-containing protein [Nocardiopsis gilva]|nr:SHOCT domain-containing protein [Nocardiopsis gilva]